MAETVDPTFIHEMKKFGATDVTACFNCGNCTAICPLSSKEASFPRETIRHGQLGLRDRILGRVDIWQCHYCGECTATCPRQADPAGYVMASRRYAISRYDVTGLARLMFTQPWFMWFFATLLFALGVAALRDVMVDAQPSDYFLPEALTEVVHYTGYAVVAILAVAGGLSAVRAYRFIASQYPDTRRDGESLGTFTRRWLDSLGRTLRDDVLAHKSFQDCEDTDDPWYRKRWVVHAATLWGFLGLLVATLIAWQFPTHGEPVPLWYPSRAIGIVSGTAFMFGISMIGFNRIGKRHVSTQNSEPSDWFFLALLMGVGVSGFLTTLAIYVPATATFGEWMMVSHMVLSLELVLLAPFTKFAHAAYRTFALWIHRAHNAPVAAPEGSE